MSLRTFVSRHSAKAAVTGLVALFGCAAPEPQRETQRSAHVSQDPMNELTAEEKFEAINKIFFNIPTSEERRSQKVREESDQRCIELMRNDRQWREFYIFTRMLISVSATENTVKFKPSEKQEEFIRKFVRLPSEQNRYMNMLYRVLPDAKEQYQKEIKTRKEKEPSLADLIFISEVSERLDYYFNFKTLPGPPSYAATSSSHPPHHLHLHYHPKQLLQSTNLAPLSPFTEKNPARTKEECIELMKNDASWRESYNALSTKTNFFFSGTYFEKLSPEQHRYLERFLKLPAAEQATEMDLLYRVIPDAPREKMPFIAERNARQRKRHVHEKGPPNYAFAAQLFVLSEMQGSMRYYLMYGITPKPPAWLQNREFYHGTRPP